MKIGALSFVTAGVLVVSSAFGVMADTTPTTSGGPVINTAWPNNAVVLYDQMNNAGTNATNSQNFEAANAAFHSFLGDDFVIPAGQSWSVDLVEVDGVYFNGTGPAASVNVWFYTNAGGNLPGAIEFTKLSASYTGTLGDFSIALSPAAVLGPGTHWLVVQANQNFTPAGQWGWTDRIVTSNNSAAWQNPGGGFATACTSWGRRGATCLIDAAAPDQVFRLGGSLLTANDASSWGQVKQLFQ